MHPCTAMWLLVQAAYGTPLLLSSTFPELDVATIIQDAMARGLQMPVGADVTGGTAMVEGEENDKKTIFTALSDCDNANAFQQDLGLGNTMIFDISDPKLRARILRKLRAIFEVFQAQHRYKLKEETVEWIQDADRGELTLKFKYVNLESEETKGFSRIFTGAS